MPTNREFLRINMNRLILWVIHLKMLLIRFCLWKPFLKKLSQPEASQKVLLRKILQTNKDTEFGRQYGFESIREFSEYAAKVPIHQYEELRPYLDRQESGKVHVLCSEHPVMYAQTSGTTSRPKLIPILPKTVSNYQASQQIFSYASYSTIPGLYDGRILAIVSPAIEGVLPTGTPYGSMSGLIYESMPRLLRSKYILPVEVFAIEDYATKYYILAAFALSVRDISFIASANPSTFLKIASVIWKNSASLIHDISTGTISGVDTLDPEKKDKIKAAFHKNEARARELDTLFGRPLPPKSDQVWPQLKAIFTWLGGSCHVYVPTLRNLLHEDVRIIEMGYLASEFRGSITVDSRNNHAVPAIHENFYEFADRLEWESGKKDTQTIEKVVPGKEYYIITTTQSGLYRYFINDVVVFGELYQKTPTLKFLEKGSGVTNLTGEKLHENQVNEAMTQIFQFHGISYTFFLLLACEETRRYHLFIEERAAFISDIASELDSILTYSNIEYKSKRASGRLHAPDLTLLRKGTGDTYKRHCLQSGQREAQFKYLCLQYKNKQSFDFTPYFLLSSDQSSLH